MDCVVYYYKMDETGPPRGLSVGGQKEKAWKLLESAFFDFFREKLEADKIFRGKNGKPLYALPGYFFNISHCKSAVAAAVAKSPVGVDIEGPRQVKSLVMNKCMDERERAYIDHRTGVWLQEEEVKRFLALWTLKESYVKMTGDGMGVPFHEVCFMIRDSFKEDWKDKGISYVKTRILEKWKKNSVSCLLPAPGCSLAVSLSWEKDGMPDVRCREILL